MLVVLFGYGLEERWDVGPVDVVAAAFALGFQDVVFCAFGVEREFDAFLGGVVGVGHGVLRGEGLSEGIVGCLWLAWEEVREVVWSGRFGGEDLLDLFRAGELEEHCWAFYGGATLEVVACCPGCGGGVLCWGVEGAEVDDCGFESEVWVGG